ncbi:MAG: hypothetical protein WD672_09750 [Woeseia sp.]
MLLAACASNQPAKLAVATYPPIVVDGYNTPSAAELYAQRYQASVTQVKAGDDHRFVTCEQSCPAATPKTPVATLNAAVARRAHQKRHANRVLTSSAPLGPIDEPFAAAATERPVHSRRYRAEPDDADGETERK